MSRELLKRALDNLSFARETDTDHWELYTGTIDELEAELAKPDELQPAWYSVDNNGEGGAVIFYPTLEQAENSSNALDYGEEIIPLYTHPPRQQEPLSDEEIRVIIHNEYHDSSHCPVTIDFVRAIERVHGIGGVAVSQRIPELQAERDELQSRIANGIRVHARYRNDDGDWVEAFECVPKPTNATLIIDEGVDLRTQSQES